MHPAMGGHNVTMASNYGDLLGPVPAFDTPFGFIPIYGNGVWLHAVLAIVAACFGWLNRAAAAARGF
jgi:hypothetical protein